jgi:hypothetical protein
MGPSSLLPLLPVESPLVRSLMEVFQLLLPKESVAVSSYPQLLCF